MQKDALICLVAPRSVLFCVVTDQKANRVTPVATQDHLSQTLQGPRNLHSDPNSAYITARLVDVNDEGISHLMAYISGSLRGAPKSLVEFPGILLPAFQSTLIALQEMVKTEDLPFTEILTPATNMEHMSPPAYATDDDFVYDISCLATDGGKLTMNVSSDLDVTIAEVRSRTSLDDMQATAFVSALRESFSLIQGPPGTGKSYTGVALMRALLANQDRTSLGPIITVAETNHALDQLLEALLDVDVTQIIRMGQFSKSDRLQNLNLRIVAERVPQTRAEKSAWGKTRSSTEAEAQAINELLHSISQIGSPTGVEKYLETNFPEHCDQLFGGVDAEGFETVTYGPSYSLHAWRMATVTAADLSDRSLEELFETNIHETSPSERCRLWDYWMEDCSGRLHGQLRVALQAYGQLKHELTRISNDKDLRVLSQADVVGVTTAGLARNLNLFRKLGSRVLLIEEAAEILESHTLSAMLPSLEHCIQIGDHLQLRPQIINYELSVDNPRSQYAMDVSLFERLIHGEHPLPYTTLNTQRRMHPAISSLIREQLYPNLQDHPKLLGYPEVAGVRHRLWWLDHSHREDAKDAFSTSFTNSFEVEFCAGLVSHIVRQGVYKPADIAVLTPYLGQMWKLRARLRTSFAVEIDGRDQDKLDQDQQGGLPDDESDPPTTRMAPLSEKIRLATVDNFQGEEAKVVIISLVRSNEERNAGFLKTPNRINVLLSRAKHGMFILGNADTQRHDSKMWRGVTDQLRDAGAIGPSLELDCPRHPEMTISVSKPDDFASAAPEAGCSLSCELPMACGHPCPKKCHSDASHKVTVCTEPSTFIFPSCGHMAGTMCSEKLPNRCNKLISGIQVELPCGHVKSALPCWEQQQPDLVTCSASVKKSVPLCEHEVTVSCSVDVSSAGFQCPMACGASLECGHDCRKPCFACRKRSAGTVLRIDHGACTATCNHQYIECGCTHKEKCHDGSDCPPCSAACTVACAHKRCGLTHELACEPCLDDAVSIADCPHRGAAAKDDDCHLPCALPGNQVPCSKRSELRLMCGHQSPSVCGSDMVPFCFACGPADIRDESMTESALNKDPYVFLSCRHFFPASTIDRHTNMGDHYELDHAGRPAKAKLLHGVELARSIPGCPKCGMAIDDISRYSRCVKGKRLDASAKKIIDWVTKSYHALNNRASGAVHMLKTTVATAAVPQQVIALCGEREQQLSEVFKVDRSMNTMRYEVFERLRTDIHKFGAVVQSLIQPFQLLRERTMLKKGSALPDEDIVRSIPEMSGFLMWPAALFELCDLAVITDLVARAERKKGQDSRGLRVDFQTNRAKCHKLVQQAKDANMVLQQVQGMAMWAQYAILESRVSASEESMSNQYLDAEAAIRFGDATELVDGFNARLEGKGSICLTQATSCLSQVRGSGYMDVATINQLDCDDKAVSSTWFRCVNGHVFEGECSESKLEGAVCNYCGEGIFEKKCGDGESEGSDIVKVDDTELLDIVGH